MSELLEDQEESIQFELLPTVNVGMFPDRQEWNDREKAFAELWNSENQPRPGVNYGYGTLQDLFFDGRSGWWPECKLAINDRDRFVAATIVQWLGTNCGFAFLQMALEKCGYRIITEATAVRHQIDLDEGERALDL